MFEFLNKGTAVAGAEQKVLPEIARSESIKNDILTKLNESDMEALRQMLEVDNKFNAIFEYNGINTTKEGKERDDTGKFIASEIKLPEAMESVFSKKGLTALKTIIAAYGAYRAPFPTTEEIEPFDSLLDYMTDTDVHNWDMVVSYDKNGRINAGYCGRQLPVDVGGQQVRGAWIEHTWSHSDVREKGLGSKMYKLFEENCDKDTKPQVVFIEIDNPPALESGAEFHNMQDKEARKQAWLDSGQSMDAYGRMEFWGKNGFKIVAMKKPDGKTAAAPYVQICMEPDNLDDGGYCATMFAGVKIRDAALIAGKDEKNNLTISPELYKALYPAIQGTIDPNLNLYPEAVRTISAVNKATSLVLLDPNTQQGRDSLFESAASLDKAKDAQTDINYCNQLLLIGKYKNEAGQDVLLSEEDKKLIEYHIERAESIIEETKNKPEEAKASAQAPAASSVTHSPAVVSEVTSLKEMLFKSPIQALQLLDAYYDVYSNPAKSGFSSDQIESKENLLKYLMKPRTVRELNTSGSLDIHVCYEADPKSAAGFRITGGAQTVEHESLRYGKLAMHIEQAWGANTENTIAGVMLTARNKGFQYLIEEADDKRLAAIKQNADPRTTLLPGYNYIQPSLTDDPKQFVEGKLRHVYRKIDENAPESIPVEAILAFYKDWTSAGDPAVNKMVRLTQNVRFVPLFQMTDEGQFERLSYMRKLAELGSFSSGSQSQASA